ncbi:MAG: TIGR01777 family oxidoreductase, partial [Myxococcota bacterium]|nr:TIGR01777 family oxidoreductase [Myxococcota bacterium]
RALLHHWRERPFTVRRLSRDTQAPHWDPLAGTVNDTNAPLAALVHLAGAPIARRWNPSIKKEIYRSRVLGTRTLFQWLSERKQRPNVVVCASAIGFYGSRQNESLTESSAKGTGFLSDVVQDWEREMMRISELGIRVVILRLGVVLSPEGGALAKMLPVFRTGVGGPIGGGKQWVSWIHVQDVLHLIESSIRDQRYHGVLNVVSPQPIRQKEFALCLGRALRRPTRVNTPAIAVQLAMGEMAKETVLASQKVFPNRLLDLGFTFEFSTLNKAFAELS